MRRKRTNINESREKRTLIPTFDPEELAKEIEGGAERGTVAPPFDPSEYARIVEQHVSASGELRGMPGTMTAATEAAARGPAPTLPDTGCLEEAARVPPGRRSTEEAVADTSEVDVETIGREMYGSYLASDFPEALVLAERVLERQPDHALAHLVAERCRERLEPNARALNPSSVLRLRLIELERQSRHIDATSSFVLGHIDGVSDAATVAALTGLPDSEALARLHALLDLGVLELVSA